MKAGLGNQHGFSPIDKLEIQKYYGCKKNKGTVTLTYAKSFPIFLKSCRIPKPVNLHPYAFRSYPVSNPNPFMSYPVDLFNPNRVRSGIWTLFQGKYIPGPNPTKVKFKKIFGFWNQFFLL